MAHLIGCISKCRIEEIKVKIEKLTEDELIISENRKDTKELNSGGLDTKISSQIRSDSVWKRKK